MARKRAPIKAIESFRALLKIVQSMQAEKDLDRLLELIISSVSRVLNAERSSLFLYDGKSGELYDKIAEMCEIDEIRLPVGHGSIAGTVAETLQPENIPDAYADPRFDPSWDKMTGIRTRNILAIPLLTHEDKLIGVIEVLNKVDGQFTTEDMEMLTAFGTNAAIAIDSAFLVEQFVEKRRIEKQIEIARSIQVSLLPKELPDLPNVQFAAQLQPCDKVSGDYYDVFETPDGKLILVIADVTHHGIGPALIMSETRAFIRAFAATMEEPSAILTETNRVLSHDMTEGRFVTCFLARLDPETGQMQYANAGHAGVFLRPSLASEWQALESTGIALGIAEDYKIQAGKPVTLGPGGLLVMSTDGIAEAMNSEGEMFTSEGMIGAVNAVIDRHPVEVVQMISESVYDWSGLESPEDDQTLLVAKSMRE